MHDHHETLSPEIHAQIAVEAMDQGDHEHARHHLALALNDHPGDADFLKLLDRLFQMHGDPIALTQLGSGSVHLSDAALHAYGLVEGGELEAGLHLFLQCLGTGEALSYVAWLPRWFSPLERAAQVSSELWLQLLAQLSRQLIGDHIQDEELAATLSKSQDLFVWYAEHTDDPRCLSFTGSFLRKLGAHAQALTFALRGFELQPTGHSANCVAMVYGAMGDLDRKAEYYERATEIQPDATGARLDLGDHYAARGELERALDWYQSVLPYEPQNPWATSHVLAITYILSRGESLDALTQLFGLMGENAHGATYAFELLTAHAEPFLTWLPKRHEAIINLAIQLYVQAQRGETDENMDLGPVAMTALEPPSAVHGASDLLEIPLEISFVAAPEGLDPRRPWGEVSRQLWRYDGATPSPALALPEAPTPSIDRLTQLLLEAPFFLPWTMERALAMRLPATREAIDALLASMLHVPPLQRGAPWDARMQCIYTAAVMIVAMEEPTWRGGLREQAMHDLLHGAYDWYVGAAVVAMGELAQRLGDEESEVIMHQLLALFSQVEAGALVLCWYEPWLRTMLRFETLDREARILFTTELEKFTAPQLE